MPKSLSTMGALPATSISVAGPVGLEGDRDRLGDAVEREVARRLHLDRAR